MSGEKEDIERRLALLEEFFDLQKWLTREGAAWLTARGDDLILRSGRRASVSGLRQRLQDRAGQKDVAELVEDLRELRQLAGDVD
jgi:hypothetical protein